MDISPSHDGKYPFYLDPSSIIRFLYLATEAWEPNELWYIGSALEVQEELFLEHHSEICFEPGNDIYFRQGMAKGVAVEVTPLSYDAPPLAAKIL
ncbi:hypothetical protein [Marinococcus sp. PL1-022]|uniref:hypothetical protein n=1 Tax=Marinococcus sp. PL1-022 TaxID=3095363 RepID=UPI0029C59CDE|nr:hypothetical protein [Marinococcus sp. PL1-022]MDX6153108.1 hypothetical protein [Marinococcus sp. PL1-022]